MCECATVCEGECMCVCVFVCMPGRVLSKYKTGTREKIDMSVPGSGVHEEVTIGGNNRNYL